MEAVKAFNNELSALTEVRPPISKAKMLSLTKSAIKGIKFYKHVVQCIEKFIHKCHPEYKVPGLYIIDAVVRQSRHQFGADKDVFGPRFVKNIGNTFQQLYRCPPDDKNRILRVLTLWDKSSVFPSDVLQALINLSSDPDNAIFISKADSSAQAAFVALQEKRHQVTGISSDQPVVQPSEVQETVVAKDSCVLKSEADIVHSEMLSTIQQLVESVQSSDDNSIHTQQKQLQQLQLLQSQLQKHSAHLQQLGGQGLDQGLMQQIHQLTQTILARAANVERQQQPRQSSITKAIPSDPAKISASDQPEVKHFRELSKSDPHGFDKKILEFDYGESEDEDPQVNGQMDIQQVFFNQDENSPMKIVPSAWKLGFSDTPLPVPPPQTSIPFAFGQGDASRQGEKIEEGRFMEDGKEGRRSRFDSPFKSSRRRSRSRSRERDHMRHSSRDHPRRRDRSNERRDDHRREEERQRRRKGMPPARPGYLSVYSTTIWFGHLAKTTTEDELRREIERYGEVLSINMIPPRGCAYVCMKNRKEASRAVDKLINIRLNMNQLKTDWAPGIGVKDQSYREFWDKSCGCTYIPHDSLPSRLLSKLKLLEDGGTMDMDTLPEDVIMDMESEDNADGVSSQPAPPRAIPSLLDTPLPNVPPPPVPTPPTPAIPVPAPPVGYLSTVFSGGMPNARLMFPLSVPLRSATPYGNVLLPAQQSSLVPHPPCSPALRPPMSLGTHNSFPLPPRPFIPTPQTSGSSRPALLPMSQEVRTETEVPTHASPELRKNGLNDSSETNDNDDLPGENLAGGPSTGLRPSGPTNMNFPPPHFDNQQNDSFRPGQCIDFRRTPFLPSTNFSGSYMSNMSMERPMYSQRGSNVRMMPPIRFGNRGVRDARPMYNRFPDEHFGNRFPSRFSSMPESFGGNFGRFPSGVRPNFNNPPPNTSLPPEQSNSKGLPGTSEYNIPESDPVVLDTVQS